MCLCQEENWKFFVLLEHLSSYNFVHRATNIKLREKGRNVVGQQLPTMLGVVASVCTSLKVFPVSNTGQQFPTTRNNMQQGMQTDPTCNIQRCRGLFARGFRCLHRVTSHSAADFLSCSESPSFHVNNRCEAKLMTFAWVVVWKYSF